MMLTGAEIVLKSNGMDSLIIPVKKASGRQEIQFTIVFTKVEVIG